MIKKKHYLFLLFYSIIYLNKIQCGDNTNKLYKYFMMQSPNMTNQQMQIQKSPKSPKEEKNSPSNNFLSEEKSCPCIAGCNITCFLIRSNFSCNKVLSFIILG